MSMTVPNPPPAVLNTEVGARRIEHLCVGRGIAITFAALFCAATVPSESARAQVPQVVLNTIEGCESVGSLCDSAVQLLTSGEYLPPDRERATRAARRGCEVGDGVSCELAARFATSAGVRDAYTQRACAYGTLTACVRVAPAELVGPSILSWLRANQIVPRGGLQRFEYRRVSSGADQVFLPARIDPSIVAAVFEQTSRALAGAFGAPSAVDRRTGSQIWLFRGAYLQLYRTGFTMDTSVSIVVIRANRVSLDPASVASPPEMPPLAVQIESVAANVAQSTTPASAVPSPIRGGVALIGVDINRPDGVRVLNREGSEIAVPEAIENGGGDVSRGSLGPELSRSGRWLAFQSRTRLVIRDLVEGRSLVLPAAAVRRGGIAWYFTTFSQNEEKAIVYEVTGEEEGDMDTEHVGRFILVDLATGNRVPLVVQPPDGHGLEIVALTSDAVYLREFDWETPLSRIVRIDLASGARSTFISGSSSANDLGDLRFLADGRPIWVSWPRDSDMSVQTTNREGSVELLLRSVHALRLASLSPGGGRLLVQSTPPPSAPGQPTLPTFQAFEISSRRVIRAVPCRIASCRARFTGDDEIVLVDGDDAVRINIVDGSRTVLAAGSPPTSTRTRTVR